MITCRKCGKDNQDHYKFCLGCGAELPRETAPKPFSPQTPSRGVPAVGGSARPAASAAAVGAGSTVAQAPRAGASPATAIPQPAMQPPSTVTSPPAAASAVAATAGTVVAPPAAGAAAAADVIVCPQCQHSNPKTNRFCAGCGYNLGALAQMAAPAPAAPAPAAASGLRPVTLVVLRADGSEAGSFPLPDSPTVTVGRDTGSIFAGDSYLSPRHAIFTRRSNEVLVKDAGSLNGVYLKLKPHAPWVLEFGDVFRIGQEIVRFEELIPQSPSPDGVKRFGSPAKGYVGRLALIIGRDTTGNAFPIPERGVHCGRERGDILFSEDGYVSGLHCRVARGPDGKIALTDVGSSNGTFVKLKSEHGLASSDVMLMGQQLFRVDF